MSAYSKLRRQHQQFVDAFVRLGVGSDAYREVYGADIKRPDAGACKVMGRAGIKEAIEERTQQAIARAGVRQVRVFEELAAIAYFDPADVVDEDGNLKPIHEIPLAARKALAGIEVEELYEGRGEAREHVGRLHKLKHWSKVDALKLLGQHLKLFAERHEVSGPNGGPIETKDVSELDKARRIAFLLAKGLLEAQADGSGSSEPGNPAGSPPAPSNKQEKPQ
ncbi:MAG TPA: terminase small subunit [Steroidobacteraceae bacterium]|nr:terminase small subunit [Steroidobacteraceae bacterium]